MERVQDLDGELVAVSQLIAPLEKVLDQVQIVIGQPFYGETHRRCVCPRPEVDGTFHRKLLNGDRCTILDNERTGRQISQAA